MVFQEKKNLYNTIFSTGYLKNLNDKFELLGLICYVYNRLHAKRPGLTYYELIQSINSPQIISDDFVETLAIICEDLSYNCNEFPNFSLNVNEMVPRIKDILSRYLPF